MAVPPFIVVWKPSDRIVPFRGAHMCKAFPVSETSFWECRMLLQPMRVSWTHWTESRECFQETFDLRLPILAEEMVHSVGISGPSPGKPRRWSNSKREKSTTSGKDGTELKTGANSKRRLERLCSVGCIKALFRTQWLSGL